MEESSPRPGRGRVSISRLMVLGAACITIAALLGPPDGAAQQRRQRAVPVPTAPVVPTKPAAAAGAGAGTVMGASQELPPERVQADVATRRVAVTATFSGTEAIIFGAVDNSRQSSPESGIYDIVIVVEGAPTRLVARRKSQQWGIWRNASALQFDAVPSFYALASTRPIDEITTEATLRSEEIGFENMRMVVNRDSLPGLTATDLAAWREAIIRLKVKDSLFRAEEYNVTFTGRSLFRASIDLPSNVTVGSFDTRVYLFREGKLLSRYTARLDLERAGLELWLHAFAFKQPLLYGLMTVLTAIGAGLLASTLFRRGGH